MYVNDGAEVEVESGATRTERRSVAFVLLSRRR
jgi:hypothetical protein